VILESEHIIYMNKKMTLENKDGAPELINSSSDINNSSNTIDAVAEGFTNMAVLDDNDKTSLLVCANCGKDGDNSSLKFCAACKLVKYCSAACQKAHRPMHKRECKQRASEIFDEKLFQEVEPEECPICMLPVISADQLVFHSCCGQNICSGCVYAMKMSEEEGKVICAFCRTLAPSSGEEEIIRLKKLADNGSAEAYFSLAGKYSRGLHGMPYDRQKANDLYLKAGERGSADAYYNLGNSYHYGTGAEVDIKKARTYYELALLWVEVHKQDITLVI